MPASALRVAQPEYVVSLADLPELMTALATDLARHPPRPAAPTGGEKDLADELTPGPPSRYTCPECGGTLFETDDGEMLVFRCRVGHGYTGDTLLAAQHPHHESALYAAIVALEERADLNRRMARRVEQSGRRDRANRYWQEADATEHQASLVRDAVARLRAEINEAEA
jgi:two-component system chemotaxis response regulator CheB